MNKTLMLVICDFLLLSMLALARFDPPEPTSPPTLDTSAASASAEAEIIALLEASLQSELNSRENLSENLTQTRSALQDKAQLLAEREATLADTQSELSKKAAQATALASEKAAIEAQQLQLAAEKAATEAARAQLAERFENTRSQLEDANQQRIELTSTLGQIKQESSLTQERLSQSERTLLERERALAAREIALEAAEAEKNKLARESEQLNRQLEIAQAEQKLLQANLQQQQLEKLQLQQEKEQAFARAEQLGQDVSKLGDGFTQLGQGVSQIEQGVDTLAQASADIKQEMVNSRPQTMSEIFTRFQNNRAELRFSSMEKNLFGNPTPRDYSSKSILVEDTQGDYFLVTHTSDTPFAFNKTPSNLLKIELTLQLDDHSIPITQIGFLGADPRLIFIPLPKQLVESTGWETFPLALEPERWEEAILVKNDESNFGRTAFKRLTQSNRFLKMERPTLGELFSDFATSRGDLAFTQNGRFIGALSNKDHAVVIEAFLATAIVDLGSKFNPEQNQQTMNRLKDRVLKLPQEVQ